MISMRKLRIAEILAFFACLSVLALPALNTLFVTPAFTKFLMQFAEGELIKTASKMSNLITSDDVLTRTTHFPPELLNDMEVHRELRNLTKVKIFTPDGLIIYSTDTKNIGNYSGKDFFPSLIKTGQPRSHLKLEDSENPGAKIFLVETYVPIKKAGRVIGAFEIYYDMAETRENLLSIEKTINWLVGTVSLSLLGAVLWSAYLVRRSTLMHEKAECEKDLLIQELSNALGEIKTLRGILPLCSFCKKIRNDHGYWQQVDVYIDQNSEADISHGICPDCLEQHYPEEYTKITARKNNSTPE